MTLDKSTLVDKLIFVFLNDIQNEMYLFGEKLPSQEELAKKYNVSRVTLRGALFKLSALGMITFKHGKGTYLNHIIGKSYVPSELTSIMFQDINNLKSIIEARQIIEKETCILAAENLSDENKREIEETIEGMSQSVNEIEKFAQWDLEFHVAIAKASKNEVIERILMILRDSYKTEVVKLFKVPGVIDKAINEHNQIFEFLKNGDGKNASLIMSFHLDFPSRIFSNLVK